MGRYRKRELLYFWVDYIKAYINTWKTENNNFTLLNSLSANSNFFYFSFNKVDFFCELLPLGNSKFDKFFTIREPKTMVNIAFIWLGWKQLWSVKVNEMIEFTGQGLAIAWLDFFYFLFEFFWFEFKKFKRIDLAMDLKLEIDYFYKEILIDKYKDEKTAQIYQNKWIVETIYFWNKDKKVNNYQLVRIYNKILDSVKKDKLFLYKDNRQNTAEDFAETGEKYKNVTRFEVEIREDLAQFYHFEDLKNKNIIFAKMVKTFYKYNKQFFKFIDFEDFCEVEQKNKIDFLNEVSKENQKSKNILQIITEKIKGGEKVDPKTLYQKNILKKVEQKNNFLNFWKELINQKDINIAKQTFITIWKKLNNSWFTLEELVKIMQNNWIK